jgi:hypothetical protein
MNDEERLQHIGELKECLANLLGFMDPPISTDLVKRSRSQELRMQADRLDAQDRIKQRAYELISMRV